ncbi:MAG TPA: SH3 domain-containing protein [Thermomicrobiales bacterium]|nr:SH3 domain-containing protein [Thermomicrobiales bacterium]
MSDPGLSYRLRQRSRRAGFMIGLSMLLTIALCAVTFTMIYSALESFTNDFIPEGDETQPTVAQLAQEPNPGETDERIEQVVAEPNSGDANSTQTSNPTPTSAAEAESQDSEDQDTDEGFNPDYQLRGVTVNLRSGPSTSTDIVTALPPSTPLEYLNEDAPTESPSDGERWMQFVTEEGLEGWIRAIDVTEYEP